MHVEVAEAAMAQAAAESMLSLTGDPTVVAADEGAGKKKWALERMES